jgi:hypothetical protein
MAVLRNSPSCLAVFLLAVLCASPSVLFAQEPAFTHERVVPDPVKPAPFSTTSARQTPLYSLELRSAEQLTEQDRLLLADSEASIAERAHYTGMVYDHTNWTYRQIVCPTFPNHLFLQFMRDNGVGDVTVFSASIPRNGEGRLRIVPVLRRGYSLFSPAPINALTIAAFNRIRAEEGESANSDWLANALCYAALAGTEAQILPPGTLPAPKKPVSGLSAAMNVEMQGHGLETIRFDDSAARPHPMEWTMIFAHNGKLVKATHQPASTFTAWPVSQTPAATQTRPAP